MSFSKEFPEFFVDPASKIRPRTEREYTALLWLFHQKNAVDWKAVRLIKTDCKDSGIKAASLFRTGTTLCREYPLFSTDDFGGNHWGDMRPDFLLFSQDMHPVVLIECKLARKFTHDGIKPRTGQLARYATFLQNSKAAQSTLLLICPAHADPESDYSKALRNALIDAPSVKGYLVWWEEIAGALQDVA